MVVFGVAGWITHDITLYRMESVISNLSDDVSPKVLKHISQAMIELQPMWSLEPGEVTEEDLAIPEISSQDLFRMIESRFSRHGGSSGTILFELSGKEGGRWLLGLTGEGAKVTPVSEEVPSDLTVKMNVTDFKALINGTLPLTAFVTTGRINVKGNLNLAYLLLELSGQRGG